MKRQKIIIAVLFISTGLWAQSPFSQADSLFATANRYYEQGHYADAENLYKKILEQGVESAELYYNLGNVAYKQNRFPEAVYYFEKALKLNPRFEKAKENLALVKRGFQYKTQTLPDVFYKKLWRKFVRLLPAEVWGFMSLVVLYFTLFLWLVFLFSEQIRYRKAVFYFMPVSFFLWIFFLLVSNSAEKINSKLYAIVMQNQTGVYANPSLDSKQKTKVFGGQKIEILEEGTYWSKIKMPDGNVYWISKDSYRKL